MSSSDLQADKDYDDKKLPDLEYTENDVADLARLLSQGGYVVTLLSDSEGMKDKARRPTGKNIRSALKAVLPA